MHNNQTPSIEQSHPHHKKNYWLIVIEGTLNMSGFRFLGANTVIPLFVETFTGSMHLVGLASGMSIALLFIPHLIFGKYLTTVSNIKRFMVIVNSISRPSCRAKQIILLRESSVPGTPYGGQGRFLSYKCQNWCRFGAVEAKNRCQYN